MRSARRKIVSDAAVLRRENRLLHTFFMKMVCSVEQRLFGGGKFCPWENGGWNGAFRSRGGEMDIFFLCGGVIFFQFR